MDLQDALVIMAKLLIAEKNYFETNFKDKFPLPKEELIKLQREYAYIQAETRRFGNIIAARPNFFDIIEPWIVTIEGFDGVNMDSMKEAIKDDDLDRLTDQASILAYEVKAFLKKEGYIITTIGAGPSGWDIGIRCNEKSSRDLCSILYRRFNSAIELHLIEVSKRFVNNCLPGLYTWADAERILEFYKGDGDESQNNNL